MKIQDIYYSVVPYDWRPKNIYYRIKCWAWKRYTTIKCRYLPHTWMDRTDVLPHTMFEILSRFIEEECSPGIINWEASSHMIEVKGVKKNVRQEMQELYDWWHNSYNKEFVEVRKIIWDEAEKHSPTKFLTPLDNENNEVAEDEASCFVFDPEFKTEDDDQIYNACLKALNKLDWIMEEKLKEMMHRLVELTPYLWT